MEQFADPPKRPRTGRIGALSALIGLFPSAFLITLLWRFPMPMGGYESGLEWAVRSLFAVFFYGLFGGFVLVPLLGAGAGILAARGAGNDLQRARTHAVLAGLAVAVLACVILASLDKLIGPW